ncbi:hypothetical protein ACIRD3_35330 [Kitasatospora sp. NPDC093550]|uniref:hypothetical protein n=1 Tax=Kitasatospora sp. NPDC093550 TaxID=3364089 RepID=UPI00380C63DD
MALNDLLRTGPASTDIVLRTGGGTRRTVLWYCLTAVRNALMAPVVLFAPTFLTAFFLWLLDASGGTVVTVVGVIVGVEYLLAVPLLAWTEVSTVHRIEFAPPEAAERFRLVRGGRPDEWCPLTRLPAVRLERSITEPYEGDPVPVEETLVGRFDFTGEQVDWKPPAGTDAERLRKALTALLGPAGVKVELTTKRGVRPKPSSASSSPWISGGSGSANAGGC